MIFIKVKGTALLAKKSTTKSTEKSGIESLTAKLLGTERILKRDTPLL